MKSSVLFIILAFSVNALSQSNQPHLNLCRTASGQFINAPKPEESSLIQIHDSIYNWHWYGDNTGWTLYHKFIHMVYDEFNNLTYKSGKIWDGSDWRNNKEYTYTYDSQNNKTSQTEQMWVAGALENAVKYTYTFDAHNNKTSILHQLGINDTWENFKFYIYDFDADNNQVSMLLQQWYDNMWLNNSLNSYSYDANNNLTGNLSQNWNSGFWVNYGLDSYAYDADNNQTSLLSRQWNDDSWENDLLYSYTYDSNNNRTCSLYQTWNDSVWENHLKNTYNYQDGYKTVSLLMMWSNGEWRNISRYKYSYDTNVNLTSELKEDCDNDIWIKRFLLTHSYDANNFNIFSTSKFWTPEGWLSDGDSSYYYYHMVGLDDIREPIESLAIYPNPASSAITISTHIALQKNTFLTIYNISGQQLMEHPMSEQKTVVYITGLVSGVYFVRVVYEKGVLMGKFMKQ